MKKRVLILLLLLILPLISLCSCKKREFYECGDFIYCLIKENREEMAAITRLSDSGNEKERSFYAKELDYLNQRGADWHYEGPYWRVDKAW